MMEKKLTLEHLAPYLPYGLRVQYQGITNLKELAEHNKKEPKGSFTDNLFSGKYEDWAKNTPAEIIGNRISVIKRIHFYKNHIRLYVGKRHGYLKLVWFSDIKPILRPLSDLTKEIEHNGERFVPMYHLKNGGTNLNEYRFLDWKGYSAIDNEEHETCYDPVTMSFNQYFMGDSRVCNRQYEKMQLLFKWHFDVFGLIAAGLAVDMNTIDHA